MRRLESSRPYRLLTDVAQLRVKLNDATHKITLLEQKIDHLTAAHKAELSDKESTVRLEMVNAIEAAFQKGYNQCSAAMKEAKQLFGNM